MAERHEAYLNTRDHRHHGNHPVGRVCGRDLEVGVRFQSAGVTSPQDRRALDTETTGGLVSARVENYMSVVGGALNPLLRHFDFRLAQCFGFTGCFILEQLLAVEEVLLCHNASTRHEY